VPVDTRDKRASAIGGALPWRGLLPLPGGGLDQTARQQLAFHYRGILAALPPPPGVVEVIDGIWMALPTEGVLVAANGDEHFGALEMAGTFAASAGSDGTWARPREGAWRGRGGRPPV
jgi:hypothetical protein